MFPRCSALVGLKNFTFQLENDCKMVETLFALSIYFLVKSLSKNVLIQVYLHFYDNYLHVRKSK